MSLHAQAQNHINSRWARVLAHSFAGLTACQVVISPGSRSTPLVLAFAAEPLCTLHTVLDERAAGFFALGLARKQDVPTVLVCTSGTAAAHYLPAIMEASQSGIPLVVLSADRPVDLHGCGAPQCIDQTRLFGVHVRFFADIGVPQAELSPMYWRAMVAQALAAAFGARPGPVHLNVRFGEPLWQPETKEPKPLPYPVQTFQSKLQVANQAWPAVADVLAAHPHGVVVCGPTDDLSSAAPIVALATSLGWPVLAEPGAQLRFGEIAQSPVIVAPYDALLRDDVFVQQHAPTCVLRFGPMPISKALWRYLEQPSVQCMMLVDPAYVLQDPTHTATHWLQTDAASMCQSVRTHLPVSYAKDDAWQAMWQQATRLAQAAVNQVCHIEFWEGTVVQTLLANLPPMTLLHIGNSLSLRNVDSFAPAQATPLVVRGNRGVNGIDGTLATFLGEAIAHAPAKAVALVGDLTFLHDVGALQLALQLGIRATVLVVNNHGGGIFATLPIAKHKTAYEPYFLTPQKADLAALCRATQAAYVHVATAADLSLAISQSWNFAGLTVIEAQVTDAKHTEVWSSVASALALHMH